MVTRHWKHIALMLAGVAALLSALGALGRAQSPSYTLYFPFVGRDASILFDDVTIVSHRAQTEETTYYRRLYIYGELKNFAQRYRAPGSIIITFRDPSGSVIRYETSAPFDRSLAPGAKSAFSYSAYIYTGSPLARWATYELSLLPFDTAYRPLDLRVTRLNLVRYGTYTQVMGVVTNHDSRAAYYSWPYYPIIYFVFDDASGNVVYTYYTNLYTTLNPGDSVPFMSYLYPSPPEYASFWVKAYSDYMESAAFTPTPTHTPTPIPTLTPIPTATATPSVAPTDVVLLGSRTFLWGGDLYLVGDLRNYASSYRTAGMLTLTFYDSFNRVVATWTTQAFDYAIAPGARTSFLVRGTPPPGWVRYAVSFTPSDTSFRPLNLGVEGVSLATQAGALYFRGQVRNNDTRPAELPLVYATLYDSSGQILNTGWQPITTPITVGASLPFTVPVEGPIEGMASYAVRAYADYWAGPSPSPMGTGEELLRQAWQAWREERP